MNLTEQLIEKFGTNHQLIIAIEELAELQKELTKHLRGQAFGANAISEIADVEIMLEQLKDIFGCHNAVEVFKKSKIKRTRERYFNDYR